MARPAFDYDPNSPEALAAAGAPVDPASAMAAGSVAPEYAGDYGDATVPTMEDFAGIAGTQAWQTANEAAANAAAARASIQAQREQAMLYSDPEYRANVDTANAQAQAAAARTGLYERTPGVRVPRATYAPIKQLTDTRGSPEAPGTLARVAEGEKGVASADVERAAMETAAMADFAQRQRDLQIDMRASELVRAQQLEAQRAKLEATNKAVAEHAQKFAQSDEVNPGRWWESRTGFQKFAAVLSAGLLGFAGMDPFAHLQAAVREDIEAQRANIDLRRQKHAAQEAVAARERNSLEDLRATLGDDRLAENVLYMAHMEEAKARMAAQVAEANNPVVRAAYTAFAAKIDDDLAAKHAENGVLAATNPETTVVGGGYVKSAEERADLRKRAAAADERAAKASERAGGVLEKREGYQADIAKEEAKGRTDEKSAARLQQSKDLIAKETAKARRVHVLASDLLADIEREGGDVPGFSPVPGATQRITDKARSFRRKLEALSQYDITDLTGAASSPEQQRVIGEFLTSEWNNEDLVISGLREVQRAMDTYISTFEGTNPRAAEELRRDAGVGREGMGGARVDLPAGQSAAGVVED